MTGRGKEGEREGQGERGRENGCGECFVPKCRMHFSPSLCPAVVTATEVCLFVSFHFFFSFLICETKSH